MEHKVLYRKYRPDSFETITGQDYIVEILKNSIKNNKIAHAYIFSGPRGTGKTTTAKVFAKSINCEHPTENGACGECEACKNFNKNTDIIELDAASNNGVDEIRQIIDNARISPSYSKYKVYIIDEVHMLTTNAFNALLLTLEEPPSNIVFILATTNIENVPITILSRCQRYDFKKIEAKKIVEKLSEISKLEKIIISDEALLEIAKLSDGGMRDALSILEQVSQENKKIEVSDIEEIYGIVPKKHVLNLLDAYINEDSNKIVDNINKISELGLNYKSLVKTTIDILMEKSIKSIEDQNINLFNKLKTLIFELNETLNTINIYVDPINLFELCFLSKMNVNNKEDSSKIAEKTCNVEQSENKISKESKEEKSKNYFPGNNFDVNSFKTIRINNAFCEPQKKLLDEIKNNWEKNVNKVDNNTIKNYLIDSIPVCASKDYLIIECSNDSASDFINLKHLEIEQILNNSFGLNCKIVSLVSNEWQESKNKYIYNTKNGIKYSLMSDFVEKIEQNDLSQESTNIDVEEIFGDIPIEEE